MKFNKTALAVTGVLLTASQGAFALEEFFTAPGTRAVSMGGAFAAVASDSSAIYYNPAGLGFMGKDSADFTIEIGDVVVSRDLQDIATQPTPVDRFDNESALKYAGFSKQGFGLAYFRPYDFYTNANADGKQYAVRTEYSEFKLGFGGKFSEGLAIGGTLDMVSQTTESNCRSCYESEAESGLGFTIGALTRATFGENNTGKLQFAAVYRSEAEVDVVFGDFTDLPARPAQKTLGASITIPPLTLGDWSLITTLSVQKDEMEYGDVYYIGAPQAPLAVNHERTSRGAEFQLVGNDIHLFFRVGSYESEADGPSLAAGWKPYNAGVEGTTIGGGILLGNWVIDYAVEKRTILDSGFTDDQEEEQTLTSVSLSYVF